MDAGELRSLDAPGYVEQSASTHIHARIKGNATSKKGFACQAAARSPWSKA